PAPGAELDPGPMGSVVCAGHSLRTPTFTLGNEGKLFYLVKGNGRAYVAVDSHVLINGPLHGQLLQPIKADDSFQWIASPDLSRYIGQRAHVEFTAVDGSDFAVARVVQAAEVPDTVGRPNRALMRLLVGKDAGSVEGLALAYQHLLTDVADRLASDRIIGTPDAGDCARLANWLVQQPALW